jgi:SulP family sulfate permease
VIVFSLSGLVSKIPLAALAGVLLATCVRMVEVGSITALVRSTRGDAVVLTLTLVITVAFDLVTAVAVGVAVAAVLALRAVARHSRLEQVPLDTSDHAAEEHELLSEHIVAYRLDGPLFFAAAHRFLLELSGIATVKIVILRMSRITTLDATGARVLDDAIGRLEQRGITVLLSGIHDSHDQILTRLGVADHLRASGRIFGDTRAAIAYARVLIHLDADRARETQLTNAP